MGKCATCQFWSEMIAMVDHRGTVSMCMADGERSGQYTAKSDSCSAYQDGMPLDLDRVPPGQLQRSIDHRNDLREELSDPGQSSEPES